MRNPLIITIGREYGSGGREIGELVAKTLGIAYYDKKLITLAAQKSGLSDEFIAINVFVYAPREVRVNRIMARHNLSEAEALKAISTSDKERGNHYFRYTDQKWGKAQNYDVCINSGLMGIEKTAEMLADMAKIEVRA